MERIARIKKWIEANPTPKQELCPELLQYWKRADGHYEMWSSKTLERTIRQDFNSPWYGVTYTSRLKSTSQPYYRGFYVEADGDMLEISEIRMENRRGKAGVAKEWTFYDRYFIFAHEAVGYNKFHADVDSLAGTKYYSDIIYSFFREMSGEVYDGATIAALDAFIKENYGTEVGNQYLWYYGEFYKKSWMVRNKSASLKRVESYDLPPIEDETFRIEVLDDEYAVIRGRWCSYPGVLQDESVRIFVSNKGKVSIMINEYGKWRLTPQANYWSLGSESLNLTPEMYKIWNPLKWIIPCIDWERPSSYVNNNIANVLKQTIKLLRHPILESMSKAGYPHIAREVAIRGEVKKNLERMFGAKEKKGSLYAVLGVNKHVMQMLEQHLETETNRWGGGRCTTAVAVMKELCGDLTHMSKESVEQIFPGVVELLSYGSWRSMLANNGNRYFYYNRTKIELTDEQKKHALWLAKKASKEPTFVNLFFDTMRMQSGLANAPDIDLWSLSNLAEVRRVHDAFIEIRDYEKLHLDEVRQQKFEKFNEKRIKKYEYEDDQFCIRVPRTLTELVSEGSALHHCVGGYTTTVAEGRTDILFLRRKADPELSFYTIEVNEGRLIQIHGACNKWLGNDPEAIPFVYEWLQKIEARFDPSILLNLGQGYGRAREALDESYLHRKESEVA